MQKITLIAAYAQNRVIGINNDIPWYIPEDFAFFKTYTMYKPVIMGRRTWDSLPRKPLPNRRNIILSQQQHLSIDTAEICFSLEQAIMACANSPEIIIMGGASIYAAALPFATDLRLTEVKLTPDGDTFFPEFDTQVWKEVERTSHFSQKGIAFDLVHWQKSKPIFQAA